MDRGFQSLVIGPTSHDGGVRQIVSASEITDRILAAIYQNDVFIRSITLQNMDIPGSLDLSNVLGQYRIPPIEINNCAIKIVSLASSACCSLNIRFSNIGTLLCREASFEGLVNLYDVTISYPSDDGESGSFNLYSAKISQDLFLEKIVVQSTEDFAFTLNNVSISGRMIVLNCRISSRILLELASIDKGISIQGGESSAPIMITNMKLSDGGFHIDGTNIGNGAVAIIGHGSNISGAFGVRDSNVYGDLNVIFSRFGASVELVRVKYCLDSTRRSISFLGADIGGNIHIEGSNLNGSIDFTDAKIAGSFLFFSSASYFTDADQHGIVAVNLSVAGNLHINKADLLGGMTLEGSSVGGSTRISGVRFCARKGRKANGLNLTRLSIGAIVFEDIDCVVPLIETSEGQQRNLDEFHELAGIHLQGVRAERVAFEGVFRGIVFDFEGAEMERLPAADPASVDAYVKFFDGNAKRFHLVFGRPQTQPYLMLARRLRAAGWHDEADTALVLMKRETRRTSRSRLSGLGLALFDATFGFGYSRKKAAVTLAAWVAIGTIGTTIALHTNALIIDAAPVMAGVSETGPGSAPPATPVYVLAQAAGETAISCGNAIDPFFYAVELVLPVFDLGQKDQCTLRGRTDQDRSLWFARGYVWWWFGKYLYTILGWVIVSLAILTFFGALKNRSDGSLS